MANSEKQDGQSGSTQFNKLSSTPPFDDSFEINERNLQEKGGVGGKQRYKTSERENNSVYELALPGIKENDETTCLIRNGDVAVISDTGNTVPEFPFSTVQVWIYCTIIMVIYILVLMSMGPLTSQYLYQRFSKDHSQNMTTKSTESNGTCSNPTHNDGGSANDAQREATNTQLYVTIAQCIPACITCLFAGSLSDSLGRKVLLVASISGSMVKVIMLCLLIKLELDINFIYLGASIDGIVGSYYVATLAVTAAISDITPLAANKAVRFAIIEGIILVGGSLSQVAIGYLIKAVGFFIPVLICASLLAVCILIVIFLLPETLKNKQQFTWNIGIHIMKTYKFYFLKGPTKHSRILYNVGLGIHLTIMFAYMGKSIVETMFEMKEPICWDSVNIGIFNASRMVVASVGAVLFLKLCKNRLSLEVTGIICGISSTAGFLVEGFANSTLMMYLSAVVGILFTASLPLPRAILSQVTSSDEQGALFSGMASIEAASTMVSATVYTQIYNSSLDTFPGAAFMLMAAICVLNMILFGTYRLFSLSTEKSYEILVEDSIAEKNDYQSLGEDAINANEENQGIDDKSENNAKLSENPKDVIC